MSEMSNPQLSESLYVKGAITVKRLVTGPEVEEVIDLLDMETEEYDMVELRAPDAEDFVDVLGIRIIVAREIVNQRPLHGLTLNGLLTRMRETHPALGVSRPIIFDDFKVDTSKKGEKFLVLEPTQDDQELLARDRTDMLKVIESYAPKTSHFRFDWPRRVLDMTVSYMPDHMSTRASIEIVNTWNELAETVRVEPLRAILGPILDRDTFTASRARRTS